MDYGIFEIIVNSQLCWMMPTIAVRIPIPSPLPPPLETKGPTLHAFHFYKGLTSPPPLLCLGISQYTAESESVGAFVEPFRQFSIGQFGSAANVKEIWMWAWAAHAFEALVLVK